MDQPRLFTLEEATGLLPKVRSLVESMQAARQAAEQARAEYEQLDAARARGNGYDIKREQLATRIIEQMKLVRQGLNELERIGCELKDLEMGLIDFPSLREGRVVNLCWLVSEPAIAYWHTLDSGYASRQPL